MEPPIRILPLSAAFAAIVSLPACGGGGESSPPALVTVTLLSSPTIDGYIFGTGTVEFANQIYVGDTVGNDTVRGFVSFDLAIPVGVTVTVATMSLYQWAVLGTPYTSLGTQVVDHMDLGPSLDFPDYGAAALLSSFGTLATDATIGFKTLVVTSRVVADRAAGRGRSQFRIRFNTPTDIDAGEDSCSFQRAETLPANQVPTLTVTYQP